MDLKEYIDVEHKFKQGTILYSLDDNLYVEVIQFAGEFKLAPINVKLFRNMSHAATKRGLVQLHGALYKRDCHTYRSKNPFHIFDLSCKKGPYWNS